MPPSITRVLNLGQRGGDPEWQALREAVAVARSDLALRVARTRQLLPVLGGNVPDPDSMRPVEQGSKLDGAPLASPNEEIVPSPSQSFEEAVAALDTALGQLDAICAEAEEGVLPLVLERLEVAADNYGARLEELRGRKPRFCDDPVFNDACVLAWAILRQRVDGRKRVGALLPSLYARALDIRAADDPTVLEELRMAIGGMVVYAEEGRAGDLSNALVLLQRAARRLPRAGDAPPDLDGSRHFHELIGLMRGVYSGTVPDRRLRDRLESMSRLQAVFQARLTQHQAHHPEDSGEAEAVRAALQASRRGFEHLWTYLEGGDRAALVEAWLEIVPAAQTLIARSSEEEAGAPTPFCASCGGTAPLGAARCPSCDHPLPMATSSTIDLLDAVSDAPDVAENFAFAASVVDDVSTGAISPETAREVLQPLWDAVHEVEHRLSADVARTVQRAGDVDLARSARDFAALVATLKDVLSHILIALHERDLHALPSLRERLLDVGGLIGYVHQEHQAAADTR